MESPSHDTTEDSRDGSIASMKDRAKETNNMANGKDSSNGKHQKRVVNGSNNGKGSDEADDMDDLEVEEEEEEEGDAAESEVEEIEDDEDAVHVNGQDKSSSRRKSPIKTRDVEELANDSDNADEEEEEGEEEEEEDDVEEEEDNDVEEVKDDEDESDGDSDIMEVEAEESSSLPASTTKTSTPNVVTIDDVKTLHRLANNAKQAGKDKNNVSVLDTNSILAGKATSGVTITPARPKTASAVSSSNNSASGQTSGVTISSTSKKTAVPLKNTAFGYDQKGQLNDPNLTDDTFVVEAPSFIVPYVYEKPPKETFDDFHKSINKLTEEKEKEEKEKAEAKKSPAAKGKKKSKKAQDDSDEEDKAKPKDDEDKADDDDIVEINKETNEPQKKKSENYFDSALGKFILELGMNLVQETVQNDLLKVQVRKSHKDKSAAVMHAIMSLKKNIETSKEQNKDFRFEERRCRYCSFRTESNSVMQHHLETPHMKMLMYRCNFCHFDTKMPQEVLSHMIATHGVRGRLERAPGIHQCPQCPFEDNMKGKLTRHKNGCDKRFRPERNQDPPLDWEPPAKIVKPPLYQQRRVGGLMGSPMGASHTLSQLASMRQIHPGQQRSFQHMPNLQMGARGKHSNSGSGGMTINPMAFNRNQMLNFQGRSGGLMNNQAVAQALAQQKNRFQSTNKILGNLGANSSVTIQSVSQRTGGNRQSTTPSISITPLPGGRQQAGVGHHRGGLGGAAAGAASTLKPGQPGGAGKGKGGFVICEICDGYIKDLEQLRNHMLWIHKVKIHPKMIYNRPPLNCQKCQFRFFTDQGLERHLLGSHGLVTASMQELANKGQDSGRCPVCGKVYQWKLLNHVAKDHQKTLKPAHLSYKCTVCTATFGQYKLFETHVYQAHSGAAKKGNLDKSKQQSSASSSAKGQSSSSSSSKAAIKVPSDITVIPKSSSSSGANNKSVVGSANKKTEDDVIELDDEEEEEEEEIDDVEEEDRGKTTTKRSHPGNSKSSSPASKKARTAAAAAAAAAAASASGDSDGEDDDGGDE